MEQEETLGSSRLSKESRLGELNSCLVVILLNLYIAWTVIVFWFVFLVSGFVFCKFSRNRLGMLKAHQATHTSMCNFLGF